LHVRATRVKSSDFFSAEGIKREECWESEVERWVFIANWEV
jgi:hypothetical protein